MKGLILTDIDLTVIDRNYELTVPASRVNKAVEMCRHNCFEVGIVSDTPYGKLKEFAEWFDWRGPIVSEGGSIIVWPDGDKQVLIDSTISWSAIKEAGKNELFVSYPEGVVLEEYYDSVSKRELNLKDNTPIFIVNPLRELSIGMHARIVESRGLCKNEALFNKLCSTLRKACGDRSSNIAMDFNPNYGVCLLSDISASKERALSEIRRCYPHLYIAYIGDGASDASARDHVNKLMAVSNGVPELKNKSDYVAENAVTEGFIECLEKAVK